MIKKLCKNCVHFKRTYGIYGDCFFPCPDWAIDLMDEYVPNTQRGINDGESCACYEATAAPEAIEDDESNEG
jgi:hypothetical protein